MLGWVLIAATAVAAWRMAAYEGRREWPWAVGAVLAAFGLPAVMGSLGVLSPAVALAGVFGGLWWMRARDERQDRRRDGPRVVR